jgi:hypothetical protein
MILTPERQRLFDLSDLSEGHGGDLPPEVAEHRLFRQTAEHFLALKERFDAERRAIYALVAEASAAVAADRHALAVAMAADEDDPGTPATDAPAEKVTAARHRVMGLADALDAAHRELLDALVEGRERWESDLDTDQAERRARAVELIEELAVVLREAESPTAALRWMVLATDQTRSWGGLPYVHVPELPVFVQGAQLQREHVLAGLREAAE